MTRGRTAAAVLVALLVALLTGCTAEGRGDLEVVGAGTSAPGAPLSGETDTDSGLPWIEESELPPEAWDTLELIDRGGPFPHREDGGTFGNFEGLLPDAERGYYAEYTVDTPGLSHRGARRIVTGDGGEYYWTQDHYESFERIAR